jgi:hypothetical protein
VHLHRLTESCLRELVGRDVRTQRHCIEIGDLVERLSGRNDFAGLRVSRENGPRTRVDHLCLRLPVPDLRNARIDRANVFSNCLHLCPRGLYLRIQNPIVPLGLIELLRGCRTLREEATHARIVALGNCALDGENIDVLVCLPKPGANSLALGDCLLDLERSLRAVDQSDGRICSEPHSLDGREPLELPAHLGGNDNFFGLEVSVSVRLIITLARGSESREQQCRHYSVAHQRTSAPIVV